MRLCFSTEGVRKALRQALTVSAAPGVSHKRDWAAYGTPMMHFTFTDTGRCCATCTRYVVSADHKDIPPDLLVNQWCVTKDLGNFQARTRCEVARPPCAVYV